MDYPKMIYAGGELSGEYRIVQDEDEEAAAEKGGFWAHDRQPKKAAPVPVATDAPVTHGSDDTGPKPKAP